VIVAAPVKVGNVLNIVVGVDHRAATIPAQAPHRDRSVLHHQLPGAGGQSGARSAGHPARADRHHRTTRPTPTWWWTRRTRTCAAPAARCYAWPPTTTGSATAIALIYPSSRASSTATPCARRCSTPALTDCVFELQREPPAPREVNALFAEAAEGALAGILGYGARRWSAHDLPATAAAAIVDALSHHGHRQHAAQGLRLVRQRNGLRLPRMVDLACIMPEL